MGIPTQNRWNLLNEDSGDGEEDITTMTEHHHVSQPTEEVSTATAANMLIRQLPITGNSRSAASHGKTNHPKSVTPANTERVTPANTERVTQANTERVAPGYTERNRTRRIKPAKSKSTSKVHIGGVDCSNSPADIVIEVTEFGITQSDIKVEELRQEDDWKSLCVTIPKESLCGHFVGTTMSHQHQNRVPKNQKHAQTLMNRKIRNTEAENTSGFAVITATNTTDTATVEAGGTRVDTGGTKVATQTPKRRTTTTTPRMGAMMMTTTTDNTPGTLTPGNTTTPTMTTDVPGMDSDAMSFNCYGLKSSLLSVCEWMNELDILFVSETWLTQFDTIHISNKLRELDYWTLLKSSIEPETVLDGRPYGGVGLICRNIPLCQ